MFKEYLCLDIELSAPAVLKLIESLDVSGTPRDPAMAPTDPAVAPADPAVAPRELPGLLS